MRILHENSVILDFQFLQLHCFQKTYWTGIQGGDQKAGNSAVQTAECWCWCWWCPLCYPLPVGLINDLILMKTAGYHLIAGKKPLRWIQWVWFIHFISQNMADIPDLYLCLIKSVQSHFKVWLIKFGNCKTPNKGRCIMVFPSLNLSVNVSKVLLWSEEFSCNT